MFVDAHCHLDLFPDPKSILSVMDRSQVQTLAMTNAPFVFERCCELVEGYSSVNVALGLHPELASEYKEQLDLFQSLLPKTKFIGEVGLDYMTSDKRDRQDQKRVFERIVEMCSVAEDKVLSVHTRRSASDALSILNGFKGKFVLHWFSGTDGELKSAHNIGAYFSVNAKMMQSERGRVLVGKMDSSRVVTETDAPLAKRSPEIRYQDELEFTVGELANLWGRSTWQTTQDIMSNYNALVENVYRE